MKKLPPKHNIYPNQHSATLWERLKVAYRIIFYKDFFPAPYDWYSKLYPIVSSEYSNFAMQAVDKAEKEYDNTPGTRHIRRSEAIQWMRHYAEAAGKSTDIPAWQSHFLIEWWILRRKGIL